MKKDCEECIKHDRNHHAADCLYCIKFHEQLAENIPKVAEDFLVKAEALEKEDTDPFCLNLTTIQLPHPGGD